ncbi:amidohydrolase family protein (plasmid) [Thioclava sp. 'Guangxiensis']|uniref:N-acetylglucosamine-6-phosphate deacetylase n=1 Tax=Thioclava sp. 'Guangxiensis' TaxID=3149044 RepID=UPI0032C487E8
MVHLVSVPFTDLQVNGGGGVLLNADPTVEGVRRIAQAHAARGTGDILPTVITDRPEVTESAAWAAAELAGDTGVLGIHIEGPHFSLSRHGTHRAADIRPLDRQTVDLVAALREAAIRVMITLAPEEADSSLLHELVTSGAIVSAGHSSATAAQARAAFGQGVNCVTHLFNAMEQMHSREAGLLGATLNSDVACGIICDGIHVSWDMLRIALKARGPSAPTFVVSDAMATVGGPDWFELYGQRISVRDGRLVNSEGALAGAHIDMVQSFENLMTHLDLPLERALAMVSDIPRRVIGLPPRVIGTGSEVKGLVIMGQP